MMPHVTSRDQYLPPEQREDDSVSEQLLIQAKSGEPGAQQELFRWAYSTARTYYRHKVLIERSLTINDAEELTGMFLLEFNQVWPRIRVLCHYTRRMLRNNLNRYIRRKRIRFEREIPVAIAHADDRLERNLHAWDRHPIEERNDTDALQVEFVRRALKATDPVTRRLMTLRCSEPTMSYREIAEEMGSSETALRMRAARFYRTVRHSWSESFGPVTKQGATTSDG